MFGWLKSIFPWHTTHKLDLDAKGVPKEFKVHVTGLSDISRVRVDVQESTRTAWTFLIYSTSFLFISLGMSLLPGPVSGLISGVGGVFGVMTTQLGLLFYSGLVFLRLWNSIMIIVILILVNVHGKNCACPSPLERWKLCELTISGCSNSGQDSTAADLAGTDGVVELYNNYLLWDCNAYSRKGELSMSMPLVHGEGEWTL